jgi:hypothetical protein
MENETEAYPWEEPMTRLWRTVLGAGLVLVLFVPVNPARADDCGCGGGGPACGPGGCGPGGCGPDGCGPGGCGAGRCPVGGGQGPSDFGPYVIWYVGVPYWFPNYFAFGPYPYTDYNPVHYVVPPPQTAQMVRERLNEMAFHFAEMGVPQGPQPKPASSDKEPLPYPTPDKDGSKPAPDKDAPKTGPR